LISLWDLQGSQEKKKSTAVAKHTFNLDSNPIFLEFNPHVNSDETGEYEILALSSTGKVYLWLWKSKENTHHTLHPDLTISVASSRTEQKGRKNKTVGPKSGTSKVVPKKNTTLVEQLDVTILAVTFSSKKEVLIVQGKPATAKPTFQIVAYKESKKNGDDEEEEDDILTWVNKKTIVLKPVNSFLFNRQTPSSPSLTTEDTGTSSGKKKAQA